MTNKYEVVPTTDAHVLELAATMRKADVDEVWAAAHYEPLEALQRSVAVSRDTRTGLVDGKVVCIFGVCARTALSYQAFPWLLGSDLIDKHARKFLRESRGLLGAELEKYGTLRNFVDARNLGAVRWLRWLGFTIQDAVPYGPDQLPFYPFEMTKP